MKKVLVILAVIIGFNAYSQEFPTEPRNGFSFPIGSKFTIKMHPTDSNKFDYSIIKFEQFHQVIHTYENDSLFDLNPTKNGTIEYYFCLATSGKTDEEKKKNMKIVLLMKNLTDYSFEYNSEIKTEKDGEFKNTSNVGTLAGLVCTEIWPYAIQDIKLNNFKLLKENILNN